MGDSVLTSLVDVVGLAKFEEVIRPRLSSLTVLLSEIVGKFESFLSVSFCLGGDSADDGDDHEKDKFHSKFYLLIIINVNISALNTNFI